MALTFNDLKQAHAAQARRPRPAVLYGSNQEPPSTDLTMLERAGDILAAPLRGLEGAAQDIYGLADTLAFDALPDYEDRVFGESRTGLGGLIEGITNFGAGFVGASFIPLGWAGKFGRLAPAVRGAVKGAFADFAVFGGHEERLSNLVQAFPGLQNPITEFLAADADDSELEGRFKNVLEGMGIGAFTELAVLSFKGLKAGRIARIAGKSPDEVEAAIDSAVPPEQFEAAWKSADNQSPGAAPLPGQLASPTAPEAASAALPTAQALPAPPVPTGSLEASLGILKTMDVPEAKAREIIEEVRRREAPFSFATLEGRDPLDPRVKPSKLTEQERMAQGMLKTDLNLSHYRGPDGALQLMRAMEQVLEPLNGLGDASRRTLKEQEQTGLRELADMVGERNPQRLMVSLQKDVSDLTALNRRVLAYKTALQAYSDHTYRQASKAFAVAGSDLDLAEFMESLRTLGDLELGVKSLLGEQGRGLGANRIPVRFSAELFDRDAVEAALHEVGGRKRALDLAKKFQVLYQGSSDAVERTARSTDLARGALGRRTLGVLNEYWYNSLLGRPTTMVVNAFSNALTTIYRPLELIAGGALTGRSEVMSDGVREIMSLGQSAQEAWTAVAAALRGGGGVLDPKSLLSDIHDMTRQAFTPEAFGVDPNTVHGMALKWTGRLVRWPSSVLHATDQFFQQLNYRTVARAQLTKELLKNPAIPRDQIAGLVTGEMDKLIHRGQAYGTAQLYKRGVEDAAKNGLRAKTAVDEYAREYVRKALETPEHARLSALGNLAQARAYEATHTAPLTPGTLPYRVQEAVLNHPYLRAVMPFVRTPVNILGFANDRTTGPIIGMAQLLAARKFPRLAAGLEHSKNRLVQDVLSGDPRRKADAMGRMAFGMSTMALMFTKAAELAEDGLPMITGFGPPDKEQRRILEQAGWQPYSIRVGDRYVSYARLDPFATVIGTTVDVSNYIKYAAPEDQSAVEDVSYGMAVALATNLTNKTYLSGLANALEMLQDPQRKFPTWYRTLAASLVPGTAAGLVPVTDPLMRDVRGVMDAARSRWPGASDSLPPLRNVLGEPVHRAKSLGSDVSSVVNAFVPILYREVSDDLINNELRALGHGFTPPKRTRGGLDLTTVVSKGGQNAFDRWLELHGEVQLGGRSLRESLRRLMTSAAYKRVPAESTDDLQSPRIQMVQGILEQYRAAALRQLTREYPEIGAADRARVNQKAQLLRGQESRPSLLQALQPPRR